MTELAIRLTEANDAVEATVAVTPANVSIVQSVLERHGCQYGRRVKVVTYPFPGMEGVPRGLENFGKASTPEESRRLHIGSFCDDVMRPVHETLVRVQSPDAVVTDTLFVWNGGIAQDLGVPCVAGAFSMLAVSHLADDAVAGNAQDDGVVEVPGLPAPRILIPRTELPEFLRRHDYALNTALNSLQAGCFGLAMNTSSELEKGYCELYTRHGYVKRAYFVGPLALQRSSSSSLAAAAATALEDSQKYILNWLDSKPNHSVVYVSFGTTAHVNDAQLDELALGLETSGVSFLWVVRGKEEWSPPAGWEERVHNRGYIIRAWAPQAAILGHPAAGAFVTQCGWNSILETVAAGVPALTWPLFFQQFITERQVTEVLGIGERLWPGIRTEGYDEERQQVVPAQDVARALKAFMRPGGGGDAARNKIKDLRAMACTAVEEGGSSRRDLRRLVDDLLIVAAAKGTT